MPCCLLKQLCIEQHQYLLLLFLLSLWRGITPASAVVQAASPEGTGSHQGQAGPAAAAAAAAADRPGVVYDARCQLRRHRCRRCLVKTAGLGAAQVVVSGLAVATPQTLSAPGTSPQSAAGHQLLQTGACMYVLWRCGKSVAAVMCGGATARIALQEREGAATCGITQ
jgi:hypothetical protein